MELFKLFGTIAIDNTKANEALDETSDKAKDTSDNTESSFTKIGGVAKNIALGVGAVGVALGGAFVSAVENTREYREEMGKLDTAFVTNGHSSENAKRTYSELNAVLGDSGQAVEASNHLALLTDNEKDLQTWTDICTGVYATFGDSLPIEGLTEAANETSKTGLLTGGLTDALNWAGISEEKFQKKLDKCTNEQERQKLIMETLNGTYKDASKQYKDTNTDIMESRKAQERLTDAMAKVGEIGEPIMTDIKNAIAGMAEKAVPVLEDMVNWFKDAITWIKENKNTIEIWKGVLIGVMVAIGSFILILKWQAIMTAASNAITLVTGAFKALNLAMKANIVGLIVSVILGLVAAFIYLWNNCDGFREFWINLWEKIKAAAQIAWTFIKNTFSKIGSWFTEKFEAVQKAGKTAMDKVKKWFQDAWNNVKKAWSATKSFFVGIWNGIKSVFNSIGTWFSNIFRNAWNGVKNIWNGAKSFFSGILSKIKDVFGSVNSWFRNKFQSAWSSIKSVFSGWGSFFSGLWTKIKSKFGSIGTSLGTSMGNAVKNGLNKVLSTVQNAINKGIGLINSAIKLANKLPGINVGTVPKISLPRLAKGGVLEKGQIGLLEGTGTEAVVPLEKNTEWIDRVSAQFEARLAPEEANQLIVEKLNNIINLLEQFLKINIYLDSGVLVGELASGIDETLGARYKHMQRGSTR